MSDDQEVIYRYERGKGWLPVGNMYKIYCRRGSSAPWRLVGGPDGIDGVGVRDKDLNNSLYYWKTQYIEYEFKAEPL